MKNQKFHSKAWINKNKVKDGFGAIYVRIYVNNSRAEISTNHQVLAKDWCNKINRVKNTNKEALRINASIDKLEGELKRHYIFFEANDIMVNAKMIKQRHNGIEEETPKQITLSDAFDYHNAKMKIEAEIGKVVKKTYARYIITKNKALRFVNFKYGLKDIALTDLNLQFVTEFEMFLLTRENLQMNTAHKYIKNLKKVVNMAVNNDWIPKNPFNAFRCNYTPPSRIVLTMEELEALRNKKFDIERIAEVRDVFLFCCFTGFSYSDIYNFEYDAITKGIDGELWLCTNRQKTGTRESVPLLPIALDIVAKYRNHKYCIEANKLLPVNSNQRYNSYLKEIADLCGIKKKITSHIARHTFATTVTLANGVPIETVSSMLGHNSIRTTQIYAKVVEKKVSEDMQLLKAKLFGAAIETKEDRKIG